ncbi:primosomal replication protein N [[Haemophilus] felis]|uniref:Replication restart protein PriB n=1 Tax=[Haemophilus] felis TaxID=123822 RepID=A0A1T0AX13_9PAST|nr:primosomal replication protein N [[Haemophilus] felis]NBI40482.1 primosomal replication protein N [[Haemophilus] felis]NBI42085.1 primosomal replication protein N [[Haemophilus] felis]OOS02099.1 primosomal replication protein N [[Haemophilus] felis]
MLKSNLKIDNRFSLSGIVASQPKRHQGPNGVKHCQFLLEHSSVQQEAGLSRQAWCKMPIQMSGNQLVEKTQSITVGCQLLVVGFVNLHKTKNGLNQLVLHAEQIEFID